MENKLTGKQSAIDVDIPELNKWKKHLGWSNKVLSQEAGVSTSTIERMYRFQRIGPSSHARLVEAVQKGVLERSSRTGFEPNELPPDSFELQSNPDESYVPVSPDLVTIAVTLRDLAIEDLTAEKRDALMNAIINALGSKVDVEICGYRSGSTIIIIRLPLDAARRLAKLVKGGLLKEEFGFVEVRRVIDTRVGGGSQEPATPVPIAAVEAPTHVDAERHRLRDFAIAALILVASILVSFVVVRFLIGLLS